MTMTNPFIKKSTSRQSRRPWLPPTSVGGKHPSLHTLQPALAGLLLFVALMLLGPTAIYADPGAPPKGEKDYSAELPRIPSMTTAEALKAFRIHPGFRIELIASEPAIASPVALDFDEDGRIYVVEFRDFNQASSKIDQGHGRISLLQDA